VRTNLGCCDLKFSLRLGRISSTPTAIGARAACSAWELEAWDAVETGTARDGRTAVDAADASGAPKIRRRTRSIVRKRLARAAPNRMERLPADVDVKNAKLTA
jgi:hypothetical protein